MSNFEIENEFQMLNLNRKNLINLLQDDFSKMIIKNIIF